MTKTITNTTEASDKLVEKLTGVGEIMSTISGTGEEIIAMYASLKGVRDQMRAVGMAAQDLNLALIKGAGGVTELASGLTSYQDKYFTDAEKSKAELSALSEQFAKFGESLPPTKEALRSLIERTGTSTDATAKLTGQLLTLTGAFSDAVDHANALTTATSASTKAQQRQLDLQLLQAQGNTSAYTAASRADVLASLTGNLRATQAAIYAAQDLTAAYNAEATAAQSTITKFQQFATSLHAFSDSLATGAFSTLSPEQKYLQDKTEFDKTAALAQSGGATALGKLQGVATQFLTDSKAYNASTQAYADDYNKVQKAITEAAGAADQQVSMAQQQLSIAQQQVSQLITINSSVQSLGAAMAAMRAVSAGASVGGGAGAGAGAGSLGGAGNNNSAYGHPSGVSVGQGDSAVLQAAKLVYQSATGGVSTAQFNNAQSAVGGDIYGATGWNGDPASFRAKWGFATGGVFTNGVVSQPTNFNMAQMGEAGPEAIMPLVHTGGGLGVRSTGGDNKESVAEIKETNRQLRALVALQSAANQALLVELAQSNRSLAGIQKKAHLESVK